MNSRNKRIPKISDDDPATRDAALARLPAWAQEYISTIRGDRDRMARTLADLATGYDPRWDGDRARAFLVTNGLTDERMPIGGTYTRIILETDAGEFEVGTTRDAGGVRAFVRAGDRCPVLAIIPRSANMALLGVAER